MMSCRTLTRTGQGLAGQFGRRSKKLDPNQLRLGLKDPEQAADEARKFHDVHQTTGSSIAD